MVVSENRQLPETDYVKLIIMKKLTESDYKQIIERRDPRYDGRFYCGVTTTKIYCRPVCPAKPKFQNIIIYKSPSAAEKAGYRACLRCRPDLAPGCKSINTGGSIVSKALHLIEENRGSNQSVEFLAEKLSCSTRHLRRVFMEQLGATVIEIIQTRKLHLAKQLILETEKQIGDIAFATGFKSIRRFNEIFKASYHMPPSQYRKKSSVQKSQADGLVLNLLIRKPYDFDSILAFLKRHASYGIESVTSEYYERYIPHQKSFSTARVTLNKQKDALQICLTAVELNQIPQILLQLRRLFDVDHNPAHLPDTLTSTQAGVRVAGSFDPFETAISIILSQLISIKQATLKLSQLIQKFGIKLSEDSIYQFPTPATLMDAEVETIGITRTKADAIRILSAMVRNDEFSFSHSADLDETRKLLLSIRGIGPWTTEMIMMRCFCDADAFPKNDLIIKRALEKGLVNETHWRTNHSYMTHYIWNEFAVTLAK